MKFDQKIALVTGGSRGLGKNIALRLAGYGADSIITYHSRKEEADSVVSEIKAHDRRAVALQLDVGDFKTFDGFISRVSNTLKDTWGRDKFDYLINNAGIGGRATIEQTTEEVFDRLFNVHFKGVYFLTQKAIPLMNDNGRIVNISSGLSRFTLPGYSAYASMKGAIETFTRYIAKELGARGITANLVAPGAIETDFTKPAFDANPQVKEMIASQTALGRVGVPDDIGGVIAFLCSEDARWLNGQRLEASGGIFL
ncbi:Oxidoreductase, short-chain dehydrogenase/reductase family [Olavius sp. associated proteobacterium Delta 1]|nr:Oxidoreductase, short-chain dehydrogenase/reductase family [Olavius sp. associated proteobacterium Delta 1]